MNTKPSRTRVFVCPQDTEYSIPKYPVWKEVRATGESASEDVETIKSGEFSENNAVTEAITVGADAKSPFNINLTGDPTERKILEWGLNNDMDLNGYLKAGNKDKWLAVRRVLTNEKGSFITDTIGCVCASLAFSIVAKQLNSVNITPNGLEQEIRENYWFYRQDGLPNNLYGWKGSIYINNATGFVYKRGADGYSDTALNPSNAFTNGSVIQAISTAPIASTGSAKWLVGCGGAINGNWYYDNGVDVPVIIFEQKETSYLFGSGVPSNTLGGENNIYIDNDTQYFYQKIKKGEKTEWYNVGKPFVLNASYDDELPYWFGETYEAKYSLPIMKFAELRNVVFTNVLGTKCVNDLSFTIDNQVQPQDGVCTGNMIRDYPNYRAITIARGEREIKGNFTSYFYDNELSKLRHYGTYFSLEFTISNGTQGYRIVLPRCKFDGGEPQAPNATDPSVMENFTYLATYEKAFYKTELMMKYIGDVSQKGEADQPRLFFGWVNDREAILEAEIDAMTQVENMSGNIEVVPTNIVKYFAILSPVNEPSLVKFINLENFREYRADDVVAGIPIVVNTQRIEGTYLINGIEYKANVMVVAKEPRDGDGLPPCLCKIVREY